MIDSRTHHDEAGAGDAGEERGVEMTLTRGQVDAVYRQEHDWRFVVRVGELLTERSTFAKIVDVFADCYIFPFSGVATVQGSLFYMQGAGYVLCQCCDLTVVV